MLQASEINVGFLTDTERELILEVLRRDEDLRRSEEQRVRRLKAELLDIRRKGAKRSGGNYSNRTCGRCQEAVGRLAGVTSQCPGCNHHVCQNCREVHPDGAWVCSVCAKEADLKKSTGDWFYDQRVNRFLNSPGHDIIRMSLKKRPPLKKRDTVGAALLQNTDINPARRPSPVPRPRLKDQVAPDRQSVSVSPLPSDGPGPEPQRSDAESAEKASLSSSQTGTESSHGTPVLLIKNAVTAETGSTGRSSPANSWVSTLAGPIRPAEPCGEGTLDQDMPASAGPRAVSEEERLFKRSTRRVQKAADYNWPTSTLDLREAGSGATEGSLGDRSKSVPGLNVQEEEEDEDIDNLVEIHRKTTGGSAYSLRSKATMGSVMSVYSEAGDYDIVDVSGDIVVSLGYDEHAQILSVLIKECHNLAYGNTTKYRSNPYVKSYLLPDKSRQSKKKTTVKSNTVNPTYNETLKYSIARSQLVTRSLHLSVWHYDRFGRNAFLGEVELRLDSRDLSSTQEECVPLRSKVAGPTQSSAFSQYKGELMISLKYVSAAEPPASPGKDKKKKSKEEGGELHVLIKEAKNLTAMKAGGVSDSFVKGYLLPSKSKATKKKTPVVKKTLNPHYDHTFVYKGLTLEQLRGMCLELTVWDREPMSSNDFLGGIRLSAGADAVVGLTIDSTEEEAGLWQKMMQYPGSWAEGTLSLRSSMGKSK